jgi:hypothetical protein
MLKTLTLLTVLNVTPADSVSGTWQFRGDVMGNPLNHVCTIQQNGTELSGSCTLDGKPYDLTGEAKDGTITFRHGGDHQGTPLTIVYSGKLESPKEIGGTLTVQPYGVGGTFTAVPAATDQ